jgi:hypothetical protein
MRRPTLLTIAVLLSGCDSTAPAPSLQGVWSARVDLNADNDSLVVALGQEGSEVRGLAILRRSDDLARFATYVVRGSLTGRSAELHLLSLSGLVVRGTLSGRVLSGTVTDLGSTEEKPLTLRPFDPRGGGVAGTYALVSTSGLPPGETWAIRDTILALPDGRARRHREEEFSSFGTLAVWSRRGDWFVLEQVNQGSFFLRFRDSLRIQPNALVRTTEFVDGPTVVETYARAP